MQDAMDDDSIRSENTLLHALRRGGQRLARGEKTVQGSREMGEGFGCPLRTFQRAWAICALKVFNVLAGFYFVPLGCCPVFASLCPSAATAKSIPNKEGGQIRKEWRCMTAHEQHRGSVERFLNQ